MSSPFQQEVARLDRFQAGLHRSPQTPPGDAMEAQIDAVCVLVRQHAGNVQAGTSLLNVRRSTNDVVNTAKAQLAHDLDQLIHILTAPTELVGDVLELYLPGYTREGSPVNYATRHAVTLTATPMHPGVLGEVSVLNRWRVPEDSPVRAQLEAWIELHEALKEVDARYDALGTDHVHLLTDVDSDLVLDADLGWDGTFLTQVLNFTDLGNGEVQVLSLMDVTFDGDAWVVTVDKPLPSLTADAVVRLVTTDGTFSGDLSHHRLEAQGLRLRVVGMAPEVQEFLASLRVEDVAQLTVLSIEPPLDGSRTLN